ncbi:IclR family transcriptional regulator [Pararhodobacter sp.]|uniref:IclR family transcriptional regulator n=1 Tax=Pararhodobacter sp. TaxID=2127056 RepID=UPI002AFF29F0|nr:IclR family transcriptional regulator [Pararhodobacter sp.]
MTRGHGVEEEAEKPAKAQRGIRSLETAGAILQAMAEAGGPMKLRDLAEAVEVAPAQLHPYLVSLRAMRMVEQTASGLYGLGPFALEVGLARLRAQDAYHEAILRIESLAEETRLMVALTVWGPHGATIVHVREMIARIHANVRAGGGFALTSTATGRLFVAFLPEAVTEPQIRAELAERASADPRFAFDEAAYRAQVARVRDRGWETTTDLPIPGVSAVCAPICDYTGEMKLAVTVIGPTQQIDLSPDSPVVRATLDFTRRLSADLGYRRQGSAPATGRRGGAR